MQGIQQLIATLQRLRAPGGCDWDRAQTPQSLRANLIEEVAELIDAIDTADASAMVEEFGDALFVLLLLGDTAEQLPGFRVEDAITAICAKLHRRHPHIFGDADTSPGWHALKADERAGDPDASALGELPTSLSPLLRSHRAGARAAAVGFDWPNASGVRAKLDEELTELDEAIASGDTDAIEDELGDVLLTLTSLARTHGLNADSALRRANRKFESRFRYMERDLREAGSTLSSRTPAQLDAAWRRAKDPQ